MEVKMETDELVRWTVKVSKDTDVALRSFLAQRGTKKGDLSKFIERAVQKEVFAQTVADVQARNAQKSDKAIDAAISGALRAVRAELWGQSVHKSGPKKKMSELPR